MENKSKQNFYKLPKSIFIETTNICNLKCTFCPSQLSTRPRGIMEFDLFKKIIDELKEEKVKHINLWMQGEPFLNPNILRYVDYAEKAGLWTGLITNGTLITRMKEIYIKLLRDFKHIVIYISYYGTDKNIFGLTHAKEIDFQAYTEGIRWLIGEQIKSKKQTKIELRLIINRYNEIFEGLTTIKTIKTIAEDWNPYLDALKEKNGPGLRTASIDAKKAIKTINDKNFYDVEILPNISLHFYMAMDWAKTFKPAGIKMLPRKHGYCQSVYVCLAVLWNGDCIICCLDYDGLNIVGNAKDASLLDIWNGQRIRKIRNAMNKHIFIQPLCQRCKALPFPASINTSTIRYLSSFYLGGLRRKIADKAKSNHDI